MIILDEIITALCGGSNSHNIFVETKDTNIYMIDLKKGTITIVFEGHWSIK